MTEWHISLGRVKEDTYPILEWCANEVPRVLVNLMDQYHSDYKVRSQPDKYASITYLNFIFSDDP